LIVLAAFRVRGYQIVSVEKKEEMMLKQDVVHELNLDFKGKMLFYDIWTMTLLHQTPLKQVNLNSNNVHTCYGEYWSNFLLVTHKKYLEDLCGKTDFISFYKCLYGRRDKVIFVFSKIYRKELIEKYAWEEYGEKIIFREIKPDSKLKNIHYSFVPAYNEFGYYVFDESFEDAN
jgi:hypothetical protein